MADDLVVLDGSTFFVSDERGDVEGADGDNAGFFFGDMRHLSRWQLLVNGAPIRVLTARNVDYYSARIFGTLADARVGVNPEVSVRRDRIVADGVHEDLVVENHSDRPRQVTVELELAADFRDLFEVKDRVPPEGTSRVAVGDSHVTLHFEQDGFRRGTRVEVTEPPVWIRSPGGGRATWEVDLAPRARWDICIDVVALTNGHAVTELRSRVAHGGFGALQPHMPLTLEQWMSTAPRLDTDTDAIMHAYRQSLLDLAALRFKPRAAGGGKRPNVKWSVPAAGLPWFMALFGRDSLITAYMALPFHAQLAASTLEALAFYQAGADDEFRDAQPGKILHELRQGKLTALGLRPHRPYYGSHDATPLFLVLLDEYERWTGDVELVRRLEPAARAALAWVEGAGDPDGDGYLEYRTRSPQGLVNQCWKDSWNSMLFADGTIAEPPIATCEIQGYAYDARVRTARLAREVWRDPALATRLQADAAALAERFDRDFWCAERGYPALALDRDKRRVDSLTSNVGHLLWSGILTPVRAAAVAERLVGAELHSGWGVRTMSSADSGYNPIEYHNGTVWPHDTAIVAEGLRRYGFREQASMLAMELFDAAESFGYRLPEVFAGFDRAETGIAAQYPTASSPQAWAAAAPLLGLRTMLGLDVVEGRLRADPVLPAGVGRLGLSAVQVRGAAHQVGGR